MEEIVELGSQAYTSVDMLEWDGRYEKMLETDKHEEAGYTEDRERRRNDVAWR